MHSPGEFPDEPSHFKLPPSVPEGPVEQAELRGLLFEGLEEALDITATFAAQDASAFQEQLRYARLLSDIGEAKRADGQFHLIVSAVEAGIADDASDQQDLEAPEFLRGQAVTMMAAAEALAVSGREDIAALLTTQADDTLELALSSEGMPPPYQPELFRAAREQVAMLRVAGNLADMGLLTLSDRWLKRVPLNNDNYDTHMDVLQRQKKAAGRGSSESYIIIGGQSTLMRMVKEGIADALIDESEDAPAVEVKDIVKLHRVSEKYGQDITVTDLLDMYHSRISSSEPARTLERKYRELADAYLLIDDADAAYLALAKALPFIRVRVRAGEVEALEDLAIAQLQLRDDEAAEHIIPEIELRYRLAVRHEQARLAITDRDMDKAVRVLEAGMQELELRFTSAGDDEDEFETGVGLDFVAMYGEIGEYERMDEAYAQLERHNDTFGPWSNMRGENASAHHAIAGYFLANGRVDRAFAAIRYADAAGRTRFLLDVMETMCTPQKAVEAMLIDHSELIEQLQAFIGYQEELRES